jgi:hypothetical protein
VLFFLHTADSRLQNSPRTDETLSSSIFVSSLKSEYSLLELDPIRIRRFRKTISTAFGPLNDLHHILVWGWSLGLESVVGTG